MAIDNLLSNAPIVRMGESNSVGSGQLTREFVNYTFTIDSALNRLPSPSAIPPTFSLLTAAARFVWMMAGSDRMESIRHYSQGVEKFTDDGFVVPGSSYGRRLFYAQVGLDQIANVVRILKEDRSSRRAMATVFQPEDTARDSADIPCTYGLSFLIRDDQLHVTTIMRSNNAWTLLPYNIFEFSLLDEVVACRIGVPIGSYTHHCISLHLYETDFLDASSWLDEDPSEAVPMARLGDLSTFSNVKKLLQLEEHSRAEYTRIDRMINGWITQAEELGPTLSDLAMLILIKSAKRAGRTALSDRLIGRLPEDLKPYVPRQGTQSELPFD